MVSLLLHVPSMQQVSWKSVQQFLRRLILLKKKQANKRTGVKPNLLGKDIICIPLITFFRDQPLKLNC